MSSRTKKNKLRIDFLEPKKRLREMRLANEWTTSYTAALIGLERRQYEQKEAGKFPFHDYEMYFLAKEFDISVEDLFF